MLVQCTYSLEIIHKYNTYRYSSFKICTLQAITRSAKHDGLKERLEQKMRELEERERRDIREQR